MLTVPDPGERLGRPLFQSLKFPDKYSNKWGLQIDSQTLHPEIIGLVVSEISHRDARSSGRQRLDPLQ